MNQSIWNPHNVIKNIISVTLLVSKYKLKWTTIFKNSDTLAFGEIKTRSLLHIRAPTQSPSSGLSVNAPCPPRKSNWIADRMKKLIKPRGGGREGRALFTAAGSVENLADSTEFTSDTHAANPGETTHTLTQQPSGFHKDTLTFSNHQARLQACIQIIS